MSKEPANSKWANCPYHSRRESEGDVLSGLRAPLNETNDVVGFVDGNDRPCQRRVSDQQPGDCTPVARGFRWVTGNRSQLLFGWLFAKHAKDRIAV